MVLVVRKLPARPDASPAPPRRRATGRDLVTIARVMTDGEIIIEETNNALEAFASLTACFDHPNCRQVSFCSSTGPDPSGTFLRQADGIFAFVNYDPGDPRLLHFPRR